MGRTLKSRDAIKNALLECMHEKPFKEISVSEICHAAGVSRTTYYRDYYSQEEVLDDLLDDCFDEVDELLGKLPAVSDISPNLSFEEQVTIYQMLQVYKTHVDMLCTILQSDMAFLVEDRVRYIVLHGLGIVERTCPTELNAYLYQEYTTAGMTRITCAWISSGCEIDAEQLLRFIVSASRSLTNMKDALALKA